MPLHTPSKDYRRDRHGIHLLTSPAVIADPSGYRAAIRGLGPLFWDEVGKVWVCSGHPEASAVLADSRRFRAARLPEAGSLAERGMPEIGRVAELLSLQMLFRDPPDHTVIRDRLKGAFSGPALALREETVRRIVRERLETLPDTGTVDIVAGFAGPLPTLLVAERLGLSGRVEDVAAWAAAYEKLLGSLATLPHVHDRGVVPLLLDAVATLRAEAFRRRGSSADDLITMLTDGLAPAGTEGEDLDRALDTVAANCLVLVAGGYQTLTNLVAMGVVLLARHPDQLAALRAEPGLIDGAIDEVMRLEGSSQYVARRAVEPVELAGHTIGAGESVLVLLGAANRDPRRYHDPERFDIKRAEGRHLGFGAGRHHCIGAGDAEQAARVALTAFIERYPRFAPVDAPDAIVWGPHANTRAPAKVLTVLGAPDPTGHAPVVAAGDVRHRPLDDRADLPAESPERVPAVPAGAEPAWAPARAERMARHPVDRAFTPAEVEVLRRRNDRPVDLGGEDLWMQAVARHARRDPHGIAVQAGPRTVSYARLDRAADVLAVRLQDLGAAPGDTVAIVMERCPEALVAALAVGRAGAAFLTADGACPPERLREMVADARVGIICVRPGDTTVPGRIADGLRTVPVDLDELDAAVRPAPIVSGVRRGDGAYTVFTSGSTGRPKPISIDHESLVNLQVAQRQVFRLTPEDRVLQWFSPNFDGWPFDAVLGLTAGARMVLAPSARICVGSALDRILRDQAITVACLTPSAWRTVDARDLPRLRIAATAGEVCSAALADRLAAPQRRVLNLYGPAEAAVWSTWHECEPGKGEPPIGRPIVNKRAYVLTPDGRPAETGAVGELWIGGVGVGRYVRRIGLTRERFRPDPLAPDPGALMYATGDLCRWRADGGLDYVGRADRQVKVQGQRIEVEEVERALAAVPGVSHASVRLDGDRLTATVVAGEDGFDERTAREHLRRRLHSGMIPAVFTVAAAPAFSTTGKLRIGDPGGTADLDAPGATGAPGATVAAAAAGAVTCPAPAFPAPSGSVPPAVPVGETAPAPVPAPPVPEPGTVPADPRQRTRLEWRIARSFASSLRHPQRSVRIDSDFFLAGGDSLSFAEFLTAVETECGTVLDMQDVITAPTPGGIARLIIERSA